MSAVENMQRLLRERGRHLTDYCYEFRGFYIFLNDVVGGKVPFAYGSPQYASAEKHGTRLDAGAISILIEEMPEGEASWEWWNSHWPVWRSRGLTAPVENRLEGFSR